LAVGIQNSRGESQNKAGNGLFAHSVGLTLMGISLSSSFCPKRTGNRPGGEPIGSVIGIAL